jgi:4-diphosphocytidyl-2-C-methyl-D-erythritol kinase
MTDRLTIHAHAKANLFLRVLAREASGFHSIETLFTLLELHDTLTVERIAEGIELTVEGADTGPAPENLASRAAEMVLTATGNRFGVRMHLEKRIPVMAGLGGGSSDGAAALTAVNRLADNAVPRHELLHFAAKLGSDVPFFASAAPLALAWGRGERMFRIHPPPPASVLVVIPPFGISTKDAYERLATRRATEERRGPVLLEEGAFETWGEIGRLGGNDFESVVFGSDPSLRDLFERLAETRPLLVRLSGSGSAVVAIYKNAGDRDTASQTIGSQSGTRIATETRGTGAPAPVATTTGGKD